jgi:D-glycero-alpha-D-manno-heptose-7-phosphate kinase
MAFLSPSTVNAVAPIRVCDIGGWTDTWFARYGAVFNIAVYPFVEVQVQVLEHTRAEKRVTVSAENFGHTYSVNPDRIVYDKHPLIEAAIDLMKLPREAAFRINIFSDAPPGASTGTSAAVSVALIGALDRVKGGSLSPKEVAGLAHFIETKKLGLQCGIQDQLASAHGGINLIEMHRFPDSTVRPVSVPNEIWWELEHRLAVIYIGRPHTSSSIHLKVIEGLGPDAHRDPRLEKLRRLALKARDAVVAGDFASLGDAMNENTEVQRDLHPDLVCSSMEDDIGIARGFGALGVKVNGAGGDGGSLTILTDGDMSKKRTMLRAFSERSVTTLPIYLSRQGLRVW